MLRTIKRLLPWGWRCSPCCAHGRCTIDASYCKGMCPHINCLFPDYDGGS